ncbi:MAG: hypothetical protein U1E39_09555 [Planctomycetota bacterium]
MRHLRTPASVRSRRGCAAALGIAAVVLVATVATAADSTYRSAHGFTVPVPAGFVGVSLADAGLDGTGGPGASFEKSFVRPSPDADGQATTLLVAFQPVPDWGRRGMAGITDELKGMAAPATPGVIVERFDVRSDAKAAPDRVDIEIVSHAPSEPSSLTLLAARAGRDGFAMVLLIGPLSTSARLHAEFAALRDGLRFDPELVYRPQDVHRGWLDLLVYAVVGLTVTALFAAIRRGIGRVVSGRRPTPATNARRGRSSRRPGGPEAGDAGPAYDDRSPPRRPSGRPGAGGSRPLRPPRA